MADLDATRALLRDRLLGWGLEFREIYPGIDLARDISFTQTPGGRDLALVRSMDNLSQGLTVALTTLLGDDPFNISFGFDGLNALAFETNPVLQRERLRMGVIRTVASDARVARILDVKLNDGRLAAGAPDDAARAELRRSRTLAVEVAFETVAGESAVVSMQGVPINV